MMLKWVIVHKGGGGVIIAASFTLIYVVLKIAVVGAALVIMMMAVAMVKRIQTDRLTGSYSCYQCREAYISHLTHSGNTDIIRITTMKSVLLREKESSQFTWCHPKAFAVLNNKREERQATRQCHYWCALMLLLLTRVKGEDTACREWSRIGAVGGGGGGLWLWVDRLFNRSQSEDARVPRGEREQEREDYQEINSKTELALLTSQGNAAQCPHGTWLPIQTGITVDLVWRTHREKRR